MKVIIRKPFMAAASAARLDGKYFSHMSKHFHRRTIAYVSNSTLRQRAITDYTCGKHISSLPRAGTSGIFLSRGQPRITRLIRKGAIISNSARLSFSLSLPPERRALSAQKRDTKTSWDKNRRKSPRAAVRTKPAMRISQNELRDKTWETPAESGEKESERYRTRDKGERNVRVFQRHRRRASRRYAAWEMDGWEVKGWKGGANHNRLSFVFGALFLRVSRTWRPFVRPRYDYAPHLGSELARFLSFIPVLRLLGCWRAEMPWRTRRAKAAAQK